MLGKVSTEARYGHVRELAVIEILARTIKGLIRDGFVLLGEETTLTPIMLKKTLLQ